MNNPQMAIQPVEQIQSNSIEVVPPVPPVAPKPVQSQVAVPVSAQEKVEKVNEEKKLSFIPRVAPSQVPAMQNDNNIAKSTVAPILPGKSGSMMGQDVLKS